MNKFHILWIADKYAESVVWAMNEEEAIRKAFMEEDEEFEILNPSEVHNWKIVKIVEVKNDK